MIELEVNHREILGKKTRFLRRQGITPVHVFGHGIKSATLQCDTARLQHVLAQAGHTRLISLKLDSEKKPRNVVVRQVQRDPLTGKFLHVDFYQVKMEEKIKVEIPIVLVGEAPALRSKENMLTHELTTLTIECLPAKIPASVELDISSLTEPEQALRVKDIKLDKEIALLNEPELVVAKISVRRVERIEEEEKVVAAEEVVETAEAAQLPEEESKEE